MVADRTGSNPAAARQNLEFLPGAPTKSGANHPRPDRTFFPMLLPTRDPTESGGARQNREQDRGDPTISYFSLCHGRSYRNRIYRTQVRIAEASAITLTCQEL